MSSEEINKKTEIKGNEKWQEDTKNKIGEIDNSGVEKREKRKFLLGLLGPRGSFTEKATNTWREIQGEDFIAKSRDVMNYYESIIKTIEALSNKEIDIAIIPIENSTHGLVTDTQRILFEENLIIRAEIILPIIHNLLSKGEKDAIKIIASHPQAIGQCRLFLKLNFPDAKIREINSTSEAARLAAESDGSIAAIASSEAAEIFKLKKLEEGIQDNKNNCTRFVVLTRNFSDLSTERLKIEAGKETMFRTSIIVKEIGKDKPGTLYEFLGSFAKRGINLTRIESKSTGEKLGKYEFFLDFEGNIENENIKEAISETAGFGALVTVIGSYPVFDLTKKE